MPAEFEDAAMVNSELRYLTLELMKIALQQRRSFDDVLNEYFKNTYKLKRKILTGNSTKTYSFKWHVQPKGMNQSANRKE